MIDHFPMSDCLHSDVAVRRGIDNTPNDEQLANIEETKLQMEVVRSLLGNEPIMVNSWFRSPKLNTAIGGSPSSAHMQGLAVDFTRKGQTPKESFMAILESNLLFDQLILEGVSKDSPGGIWVHIGFAETPRRQAMTCEFIGGHPIYKPFLEA